MKVIIISKKGRIIKFNIDKLRETARGGKGCLGMKLSEGDEVISMVIEPTNEKGENNVQ